MRFIEVIVLGFLLGIVSVLWTSMSGIPFGTSEFTSHASSTFITLGIWSFILYIIFG